MECMVFALLSFVGEEAADLGSIALTGDFDAARLAAVDCVGRANELSVFGFPGELSLIGEPGGRAGAKSVGRSDKLDVDASESCAIPDAFFIADLLEEAAEAAGATEVMDFLRANTCLPLTGLGGAAMGKQRVIKNTADKTYV